MADIRADIVIVGGGHAGLLAAIGFANAGFDCRVVDGQIPVPTSKTDSRSLALLAGSQKILKMLGAWGGDIEAAGYAVREIEVCDRASETSVRFGGADLGHQAYAFGFENGRLRYQLYRRFIELAGEHAFIEGRFSDFNRERNSVRLGLDGGRSIEAALLIGADGRGSAVRWAANIGLSRTPYPQTATVFACSLEQNHSDTVLELLRPTGPLATLPLAQKLIGITWVNQHRWHERRSEADFLVELEGEFGGRFGAIELASRIAHVPLSAQHALRYVAPRLALIGDAAHGVHPIHAQGFNMGIGDVGALVEGLIAARQRSIDIGSGDALRPYARRRMADNIARFRMTDGMNRVFATDLPPIVGARGAALRALQTLGPLRKRAIQHGMQVSG